jgi:hypothetical protein
MLYIGFIKGKETEMTRLPMASMLDRLIRLIMSVPDYSNEPIHNAIILSFNRKDAA